MGLTGRGLWCDGPAAPDVLVGRSRRAFGSRFRRRGSAFLRGRYIGLGGPLGVFGVLAVSMAAGGVEVSATGADMFTKGTDLGAEECTRERNSPGRCMM